MHTETKEKQSARAPMGHRLSELPLGRTKLYELIGKGELDARKCGDATIVLNWNEYVSRLPKVQVGNAA